MIRITSIVNAVPVASGDVDVVDEENTEVDDADDAEEIVAAEEAEGGDEEGIVDCADGDETEDDEDCERDVGEATSEVLDRDERMPTLTPNGAVADALALVWDVIVVLTLSGTESVKVDVAAVDALKLDEVLTMVVELVLETKSDVARESELNEGIVVVVATTVVDGVVESDDTRLEDEYNVAVDVEFTYSVVVEYIVIVVQVVGDCATTKLINAPVASNTILFMVDIRCEAIGCARLCETVKVSQAGFYHGAWKHRQERRRHRDDLMHCTHIGRLEDAVMIRRSGSAHQSCHQYAQSSAIKRVRDLQRVV